jgi:proton glutamate symport protein
MANPLSFVWRLLRRTTLTHWIMVSMVVGFFLGWLAPAFSITLKPLATLFLRMIKMLIVPLIFSTLVVGIAGHGDDMAQIGRLALKSLVYFEVVTTIALAIGLAAVNIARPGDGVSLQGKTADKGKELSKNVISWSDELNHIVPESFFKAGAENEVLQIVFCSILFAIALAKIKKTELKKPMLEINQSLSEIMFKVTEFVMYYAPIGIGVAMASSIGTNGIGVIASLGKLVGTLYIALIVFILTTLVPIMFIARLPIMDFLRAIAQPVLIGFSTASSEAAMPKAMENLEAFGCSSKVVAFVIPTGYSFNLDGTTLYLSMATVFCAQAGGIELDIGRQIIIMLSLMLTSKGVAGVPRASMVVLSGALTTYGLPLEAIGLILGVDAFMDMARTATNLMGNCLATAVMSKWEGEFRTEEWHAKRREVQAAYDKDIESGAKY